MKKPADVDAYIAAFPKEIQERLGQMRAIIKKAAPEAEEVISYNMPAYKKNGILVYFAGYKNHTGFYPTATPMKAFAEVLAAYKSSKGAVQFPHDKRLPVGVITKMVKYKLRENKERQK